MTLKYENMLKIASGNTGVGEEKHVQIKPPKQVVGMPYLAVGLAAGHLAAAKIVFSEQL